MNFHGKRQLSIWLGRFPPLRWGMHLAATLMAPRQPVGAVGAVFNDVGQVLLVEHVFRTDFPWGLPGGWIEQGEDPADTVRREIEEELELKVQVKHLLLSGQVGLTSRSIHPPHLGLAFYCRFVSGECVITPEVLSVEWTEPQNIQRELAPFQYRAIMLAKEIFDHERLSAQADQS